MLGINLGVDLGGTNISSVVCDETGKIIGKASAKSSLPCSPEDIAEKICSVITAAIDSSGFSLSDFDCVGVGAPGISNRKSGVVEYSCNLGFCFTPLAELIEKILRIKVYIDNDANTAALGEFVAGAGRNTKNMVAVTLGTGIGGGVIIDGKIYSGFNNAGGELGHIVIHQNGEKCSCGRRGCFESYASATALIRQTKSKMNEDPKKSSVLWQIVEGDITRVDGRTAFEAARFGDKAAGEILDAYISYLACGLTNIINIFQPEVLCMSGGISAEGERLLAPVRKIINNEDYARNCSKRCRIVQSELGLNSGVIGAALLPIYSND